jgi:hypothetical protein
MITPPLCPIGSSRYSEEDKWFFYFAHLLNVGSKKLANPIGAKKLLLCHYTLTRAAA